MGKKVFPFVFILANIFISIENTDAQYTFEQYQIQFGKVYESQESRENHKVLFQKNYKQLLQLKKINPHIQVSKFLDWSKQQHQKFFSFRVSNQQNPFLLQSKLSVNLPQPPNQIDYRALNKVTPVKDQKNCGCCWSFAGTAAFESQLLIHQNKQFDLAEQYALQCQLDSKGCQGGSLYKTLRLLNSTGAPLQTQYPYKSKNNFYSRQLQASICTDTSSYVRLNQNVIQIQLYLNASDNFLKSILAKYGPVVVGINGNDSSLLNVDHTGIIDYCKEIKNYSQINHAVLVVGYTKDHWIIKNSWSTTWGDQGFGYVSINNDCGITKSITVFATESIQPASEMKNITIYAGVDKYHTSWGNWVIGVMQNNKYVEFISFNGSRDTFQVSINSTLLTKIVVYSSGTIEQSKGIQFLVEVGKLQIYIKGLDKYLKQYTSPSYPTTLFTTFCLSVCVPREGYAFYYIWLTDTYGDGWNGNVLQFKQGNQSFSLGENFVSGFVGGPITLQLSQTLPSMPSIKVSLKFVGEDRQEIGYKIVDKNGQIVTKWTPGTIFPITADLQDPCTNCNGSTPANKTQDTTQNKTQNITENKTINTTENITQNTTTNITTNNTIKNITTPNVILLQNSAVKSLSKLQIGLIAGIGAQALLSILLMAALIWICKKNNANIKQNISPKESMQSLQPTNINKQLHPMAEPPIETQKNMNSEAINVQQNQVANGNTQNSFSKLPV